MEVVDDDRDVDGRVVDGFVVNGFEREDVDVREVDVVVRDDGVAGTVVVIAGWVVDVGVRGTVVRGALGSVVCGGSGSGRTRR